MEVSRFCGNGCTGEHSCLASELVNGKRGISPEMAVRLSKVFGGSAESWLAQQTQCDLAQVHADRIKLKRLELTVASSSKESPRS